jgi:hypothetical protein
MYVNEFRLIDDIHRPLKFRIRLPRKSHDDVGRDRRPIM